MRIPRLQRLAAACRLSSIVLSLALLSAAAAGAATLSGRVVDPDKRPVANARVMVADTFGTRADRSTAEDGRFEIMALSAGTYDLRVVANGFTADPIRVTLAADETREVALQLHLAAVAESIVVSAAQIDVPLSRTPDSVTVVTAGELQARQSETVADALRLVPGLAVVQQGDRGALTSLFPRGGGSNYTLVLVDGIRVNSFGGGYDFGHLPISNVERIEIVRGPQSALFGSDAVGGVVQIVTRRGGAPRADALIEGGSQGTVRTTVDASGSHGPWSWGAGLAHAHSNGFTGIAPANGETVTNDDDHLTQFSGSLGWQQPSGVDFLVNTRFSRDERGSPGPFGSDPTGAFFGVDKDSRSTNHTGQASARFSHPWSPRIRQRVEVGYMDLSSDFASGFGPSFSGSHLFDGRIQEDLALSTVLGASAGVQFLRERGSSTFITGVNGTPIQILRSVTGTFGELRYQDERLSVTAGARVERLARDRVEADPFGFPPRPEFPEQTINSFNPKVAASYVVVTSMDGRAATRVHTSAGTGIRPPDAFEVSFTNNPNLKPERSRSLDLGVEQRLNGGLLVVDATTFFNTYDDLLVTVGASLAGASQYSTDNLSNARARGLELSTSLRPHPALTIRANYTFLDSEILSVDGLAIAPTPFKVGDALLRRPRHQGSVNATMALGRTTAFAELTSRGEALDVEPNFGSFGGLFFSQGYTVVNVGGAVRVAPHLEVYARVLNLADRQYEEALGFPALRRSGIVGLRVATSR